MKKKGNVAVIAIIIVIVAVTAGAVGRIFVKKTQAPIQQVATNQSIAPVAQTEPTTPATLKSTAQTIQTQSSDKSSFKSDEKGNFYGTVVVTGYTIVKSESESFCEENCKKYSYVFFQILNTDNVALFDFLNENKGNSFVGDKQVGLGCLQNKNITYFNASDKIGMKEYTLSASLSKKIMESNKENPITIKLERQLFTSGSGAPACYSHFTHISDLK